MVEKIKKRLISTHHQVDKFFYFLLKEVVLPIFVAILGVFSWMYPVFSIWTDVIDKEFNLLKSIGYILIGIILFYTSLALYKMKEKLKTNNEP